MRNFYEIDWQMLEESRLNDFFANNSEGIIEVKNISENIENDSEEVIIEENIENDSEEETEVVIEKK